MELTQQQLKAAHSESDEVLIVGKSNTGKTTVLAERIAWLIENGASADSILCFTSDWQSVQVIRNYLIERLGEHVVNGSRRPLIGSYAEVALHILRTANAKTGYTDRLVMLGRSASNEAHRIIIDETARVATNDGRYLHSVLDYKCKGYSITTASLAISQARSLLVDDEQTVEAWRKRIKYVLHDDFGQSTKSQRVFVYCFGDTQNLTVATSSPWADVLPYWLHELTEQHPEPTPLSPLNVPATNAFRAIYAALRLCANELDEIALYIIAAVVGINDAELVKAKYIANEQRWSLLRAYRNKNLPSDPHPLMKVIYRIGVTEEPTTLAIALDEIHHHLSRTDVAAKSTDACQWWLDTFGGEMVIQDALTEFALREVAS